MTQEDLAKYIGITQPQLARWESCRFRPRPKYLIEIQKYLDLDDPSLRSVDLEIIPKMYEIPPEDAALVEDFLELETQPEKNKYLRIHNLTMAKMYAKIRDYRARRFLEQYA